MSDIYDIFCTAGLVLLVILLLFSFIIHVFRIGKIIATNIKTGQGSFLEWIYLGNIIGHKYYLPLIFTLWSKQKALIYMYIKNKYVIWILDSFLSFPILKSEWVEKNWKHLILRASIYCISFQCWYIPCSIYICMFSLITVGAAKDLVQDLIYPYHTSFDFQTLPLPFQRRFYELQKPVTRFRFSKAYFPLSLKSTYNKIYVDNLYINQSQHCHMIYENFARQQSSPTEIVQPSLTIGYNTKVECKCPKEMLNNISVVNMIIAVALLPEDFSHTLSFIDCTNVKFIEIFQSSFNSNDLEIISTMKLKFASFDVDLDEQEAITIHDFLQALAGVPHFRVFFEGECGSPDDFAVQLVEWVLENGYIVSLVIRGYFLDKMLDFKSSKEISIFDTFDLL